MRNDSELLRRYSLDHDQMAFTELVRRYANAVYSMALRRVAGDAYLARDISQEVFVIVAREAHQLRHHPVLMGWLYVTTRNVAVGAIRRVQRQHVYEQEAQLMKEALAAGSPEPDWNAIAPFLESALDALGETDRRAILLRFFSHYTLAEIGIALGLTAEAARKRVDRAIERLQKELFRIGIASTSSALAFALEGQAVNAAPSDFAAIAATQAIAAIGPEGCRTGTGFFAFLRATKLTSGALVLLGLGVGIFTFMPPILQPRKSGLNPAPKAVNARVSESIVPASERTGTTQAKLTSAAEPDARNNDVEPRIWIAATSIGAELFGSAKKTGDVCEVRWNVARGRGFGIKAVPKMSFLLSVATFDDELKQLAVSPQFAKRNQPLDTGVRVPGFLVVITRDGKRREYGFPPGDIPEDLEELLQFLKYDEVKEPTNETGK
jgi:RNA polymerase sigma factor (sigma-70 family)